MRTLRGLFVLALACEILVVGSRALAAGAETGGLTETMRRMLADKLPAEPLAPEHEVLCVGGMAGSYPCDNVDLLEFLPLSGMGGAPGANDIWGWTAQPSGREFALVGLETGTAFVEITDPESAVYLGTLPSTGNGGSIWRDIKTYQHYAYIVSDSNGAHGMQVFDLEQLLNVVSPPVTFTEAFHYGQIGSAHNIAINEATGYAYIVGGSSAGTGTTCSGGLHMVDIQTPVAPAFAGCFSADGYTHDTQCVVYAGPDTEHAGDEICFSSNEDTVTITDVSSKAAPVQLSRTEYAGSGYTHQGWLTEDQRYLLVDDELDEQNDAHNTYTYVWDVSNLELPTLLGHFTSPTAAIDHNLYVKGNFVFQANYRSGLRILRLDDPASAQLSQVGYFDVYPSSNSANFNGAWSVYPYFPSGNIVVSGIEQGLFVLRPNLCIVPPGPTALAATPNGDQQIDLSWSGSGTPANLFAVERALGGCGGTFETIAAGLTGESFSDLSPSGLVTYGYRVREQDATGFCASESSSCVEAVTTGQCTAPPIFPGLATATNAGTSSCRVDLAWPAVSPLCGGPVTYNVYRGSDELFVPDANSRIAQAVPGTAYADGGAPSGFPGFYIVRAVDNGNGNEEANLVRRRATATGPVEDGTFSSGAEIGDPPLDTLTGGGAAAGFAPEHAGWHPVESRQHSGARSFGSGNAANACTTLEADVDLSAGQSSQLTFWTVWDLEATYDGGIVQVSNNGGGSWTTLTPAGGYPNTITENGNACPAMPPGTPAFSSDNQFTWQQKSINLSAYAGQTVRIAWRYGSDTAVNGEGWFIDDLVLTHAQIPGSCTSSLIFADGFATGTTGAWSAAVP